MNLINETPKDSIIFENDKVIVALAFEPLTKGHCVVIWKSGEKDINILNTKNYEYLMDIVNLTRNTLKKFYMVEKVYLMYLDECNWVHWHLIPRYDEEGFNVLNHKPVRIDNFQDVEKLSDIFKDLGREGLLEN